MAGAPYPFDLVGREVTPPAVLLVGVCSESGTKETVESIVGQIDAAAAAFRAGPGPASCQALALP